ncbi:MAG: trypsin-like peptidase domain-containing protein [Acidimicrobiia bacterium]|nr:trypsin-like peptidase domain-containing protein [Acidimicrobiia bacterium]MYC44916.1 trypsin-like peptidase domain-containing protein [Acidimicrobiia bacterium]MYI20185.1 trypsin-like peptidase domain-containing protein [Acidimicrobiia bacterium]
MSMLVGRPDQPATGGSPSSRRPLRWALLAAAGLALGLMLWGALREATPVGSFVTVTAVGCSGRAHASGFAVADDLVVTAAHPVAGRRRVAVTDTAGRSRNGFVVALDPALDVAAVRVPGLGADPVSLAAGDDAALAPAGGRGVVAAMSDAGVLTRKPVEVIRRVRTNIEDVYRTARVSRRGLELSFDGGYGDSGAAVLNGDGTVVGMVFATSRFREEVGYAVRAVEVRGLLSQVAELPRRTACP